MGPALTPPRGFFCVQIMGLEMQRPSDSVGAQDLYTLPDIGSRVMKAGAGSFACVTDSAKDFCKVYEGRRECPPGQPT